jgi:uncharacterized membrane protein
MRTVSARTPGCREGIRLRGVLLDERPLRRNEDAMTLSRKTWIAIGVLAVVAAIAVVALVASGGGDGATGGY